MFTDLASASTGFFLHLGPFIVAFFVIWVSVGRVRASQQTHSGGPQVDTSCRVPWSARAASTKRCAVVRFSPQSGLMCHGDQSNVITMRMKYSIYFALILKQHSLNPFLIKVRCGEKQTSHLLRRLAPWNVNLTCFHFRLHVFCIKCWTTKI